MILLNRQTLISWQDNSNFRVTTDYVFELINVTDNNFYPIWVKGPVGHPQLTVSSTPDTTSEALEFAIDNFPSGGPNGNYRINDDNVFQLYNITTDLFHSVYIGGTKENPTLVLAEEGEE